MRRKLLLSNPLKCGIDEERRFPRFADLVSNYQNLGLEQCDQIGRFFKDFGNKISCKRSPKCCCLFGLFLKKTYSYVNTALATFWATFGKIWATFYSNIWSLWLNQQGFVFHQFCFRRRRRLLRIREIWHKRIVIKMKLFASNFLIFNFYRFRSYTKANQRRAIKIKIRAM